MINKRLIRVMAFKATLILIFIINLIVVGSALAETTVKTEDHNKDGKIDTWKYYENGINTRVELDRSGDGKPDFWIKYENGKKKEVKGDFNADGKIDTWGYSEDGRRYVSKFDINYDGRVDSIEYCDDVNAFERRNWSRQEMDRDFDGKMDIWVNTQGNGEVLIKVDTNKDSKIDKILYSEGKDKYERGEFYRVDFDNNNDGIFDTFIYYTNGEAVKIEKDENNDGKVDKVIDSKALLYFPNLIEQYRMNKIKKELGLGNSK